MKTINKNNLKQQKQIENKEKTTASQTNNKKHNKTIKNNQQLLETLKTIVKQLKSIQN